jgi:shikimate kinase
MFSLKRTVALVGMMGAGKSSVGRRLACRLAVPFCDADSEIEIAAGCSIVEIFNRFGEAAFREGERRVMLRLLHEPPHILATGGGALIDPITREQIAKEAISVWLRAPLEVLVTRVSRRDTRPLLRHGERRETMERLLAEREPFYAQAEIVVDVDNGPHGIAVERIVAGLEATGILETA